ncbi:MAG: 50S ribosomal protein L37ae [Thermoplasmata archaeon]
MSRRTKKVGPSGSLGPRYGVKARRRIREILEEKSRWHPCPRCRHPSVKRVSSGVWRCRRCDYTFAGGAYRPVVTTSVKRQVSRRISLEDVEAPEGLEE